MQLLRITTTPIKYEYKVERARIEPNQQLPKVNVSKTQSKLEIQTKNIAVKLDTVEMRKSLGLKSAPDAINDAAQEGIAAAQQATAEYAEIGNQMAQIHKGASIPDIMYNKLFEQPTTKTVFLPSVGPQISWDPNQIDINYTPPTMEFDWQTDAGKGEYIPGDFSLEIQQYPKVEIEYLGEPIYAPPSANPNYKEE